MRRVIVESPFRGASPEQSERNRAYLAAALRDCLRRDEAPFASHAIYTLPGVLDDNDPEQRLLGIQAGLVWGAVADATVVYEDLGISSGMQDGIDRAFLEKRPVEYRKLEAFRPDLQAAE